MIFHQTKKLISYNHPFWSKAFMDPAIFFYTSTFSTARSELQAAHTARWWWPVERADQRPHWVKNSLGPHWPWLQDLSN